MTRPSTTDRLLLGLKGTMSEAGLRTADGGGTAGPAGEVLAATALIALALAQWVTRPVRPGGGYRRAGRRARARPGPVQARATRTASPGRHLHPRAHPGLDEAVAEVDRLARMVNGLLALARLEHAATAPAPSTGSGAPPAPPTTTAPAWDCRSSSNSPTPAATR
ncbi:hypothetical protein AB0392_19130 [Nonomuraea angiospora]|uniref:hypothetical protein n=1 Tax=Nonomuraea angiospora TaxID=46172 RepID=UPI00344BF87B